MEDDEVFEDALEDLQHQLPESPVEKRPPVDLAEVSLALGIKEAQEAIDHFFNNNYEEAKRVSEKYADRSIYHAMGLATFHYLKAVMTFEQEHIEKASQILSQSVATIDSFRRKTGIKDNISKIVKKQDYDNYTELECHAELVFAECLLLKAMLTVCEDETLVSFVKAGLKIRQCYLSVKECYNIHLNRDMSKDEHRVHFEGGVRLAVGTFHLLMSMLPARVNKFLEFVGLAGSRTSKDVGMQELTAVFKEEQCLRQFCASIFLLGYHLFLTTNLGRSEDCNVSLVEEILDQKLKRYPNGAFFLFFKGRAELISGRCESASKWYTLANNSQMSWVQFQHVGSWELLWSSCYRGMWEQAVGQADRLLSESRWSPCLYSYMKAALLSHLPNLTQEQKDEQKRLMEELPKLKQRIAGKSLPMEKFVIKKAEKFKKQKGNLVLPGVELVYLWHGFPILGKQYNLVENFYLTIEDTIKKMKDQGNLNAEDDCLLHLLRGMCLKHMSSPLQAEECFRTAISLSSQVTHDKYLVPYATFELALIQLEQGDLKQSRDLLEKVKAFKDYCLLNRLHFRIHAASEKLKEEEKKMSGVESNGTPTEDLKNGTFSNNFTNLQGTEVNPQI